MNTLNCKIPTFTFVLVTRKTLIVTPEHSMRYNTKKAN